MSLGYIGYCKKISEDDLTVCYAYSGSNWNLPTNDSSAELAYDGDFAIDKSILQWKPAKPRVQTEYIHWTHTAIENRLAVIITECKNAFYRHGMNFDYIVLNFFIRYLIPYTKPANFPKKLLLYNRRIKQSNLMKQILEN